MARERGLPYDEPWGWMQPVLHAYCALKLELCTSPHGAYDLAEKTRVIADVADMYMGDLGMNDKVPRALQHPNNVWSLIGLQECLVRLGREEMLGLIVPLIRNARALADVDVVASCFCRGAGFWEGSDG